MHAVRVHLCSSHFPIHISLFHRNILLQHFQLFYFYPMAVSWYKKKWAIVLLHAAVWTLLFLFPVLLQKSVQDAKDSHNEVDNRLFVYLSIFTDLIWIAVFYFNAYVLIPKLLYKRRTWMYVLIQLIILSALAIFHWLFFEFIIKEHKFELRSFFLFNTFPYVFILACSTAYRSIQDRMQNEQQLQERQTENLKTELSFLRSQVNPHFMFNVLNNMVALARKKSDLLEPSLIQLSSLLRYMLYETDEDKVPLQKEVEYLRSYIDLQQQRFGKNLLLNVAVSSLDNTHEIEPMLLIPFVENAFKHGTGLIEKPQIDVMLKAEQDTLNFVVKNKYSDGAEAVKDKTSGIGLTNVKRRLNLLYGTQHTLEVKKEAGWFITSLQLKLH